MKTWEIKKENIEVIEIEHDYDLHAFEVYHNDELISTIYPATIEDMEHIIKDLDAGESPYGWEDGMGNTIYYDK